MWRGSGKPTAESVMEARLWMRGGREVRVLKAISVSARCRSNEVLRKWKVSKYHAQEKRTMRSWLT